MTSAQIQVVKKSWRLLRHVSPETVAGTFYTKLFLDHPELRRMFPENMGEQYQKIMDMLSSMVVRLENTEGFQKEISALAKRHEGYGVKASHYAMVGSALLWTLEKGLGRDWNSETAEAWAACYAMISDAMQPGVQI